MKTIIQANVSDQQLTINQAPIIASGGVLEDEIQFSFSEHWNGFTKTCVFWQNENETYSVALDLSNHCTIPYEVLTKEGKLYFGIFAVADDETVRTSTVGVLSIKKGVSDASMLPEEPSLDLYEQLLQQFQVYVSEAQGYANDASNYADSVNLDYLASKVYADESSAGAVAEHDTDANAHSNLFGSKSDSPSRFTALPTSGTQLIANAEYRVLNDVGTYQFKFPVSGDVYVHFATGSSVNISFATGTKFIGSVPDFVSDSEYEMYSRDNIVGVSMVVSE